MHKTRLEAKKQVVDRINELTRNNIFVAFSGGADSSLLLKLACDRANENGTKVYAVMIHTRLHPVGDLEIARKVAKEVGAEFIVVTVDELNEAGIENNPKNRCYLCKKCLFTKMLEKAAEAGVSTIIEGTNGDDLKSYRPGIAALKELGIISPLAEYEITKQEVREWLSELGVSVAKRPSLPCLATRLPYGTAINYELLEKVDKAETFIKSMGFYNVRLRVHRDVARIEVDEGDILNLVQKKQEIIEGLKSLGFVYITLDLEGFRSGSMDVQ